MRRHDLLEKVFNAGKDLMQKKERAAANKMD